MFLELFKGRETRNAVLACSAAITKGQLARRSATENEI
jgi:hypothetical protein